MHYCIKVRTPWQNKNVVTRIPLRFVMLLSECCHFWIYLVICIAYCGNVFEDTRLHARTIFATAAANGAVHKKRDGYTVSTTGVMFNNSMLVEIMKIHSFS